MCRGCRITIDGASSCEEYLDWLSCYHLIIEQMKQLENKILAYENKIDSADHEKTIDKFRRRIINTRRFYSKLDIILNDI